MNSKKWLNFFGLQKNMIAMLSMVILVGMGEKMAERFLPIYIIALGASTLIPGLLNGFDNLLSALYSFPGGYVSDRLGYKKSLLLFNLLALVGYLIVIIFPYWQAVIVGSVFFLSWTAISLPATISMVSKVLPANKRTMGISMHSLIRRIPMALGPILGGILIDTYGKTTGVRYAFIAAFIMGVIALIVQQIYIDEPAKKEKSPSIPLNMFPYFSKNLKVLLVSDILIRFCEQIPYAYMAIWAIEIHKISGKQFGVLTAVEMAVAMLIYIPVAYLADKGNKKPYIVMTFIFFTVFPLFMWVAHSFLLLLVAFVIRGLKEFGEPTRKALIMDLAPNEHKATVFGFYYLMRDLVVSLAAFGSAWLWQISPTVNLLTAFGFGLLGTLFFVVFGKDFDDSRESTFTTSI